MPKSEGDLRERRRAHGLLRRVQRFLTEEWEWDIRFADLTDKRLLKRFGFGRPVVGALISDEYAIYIDPSFRDFFGVLVHECLHAVFPEASESQVLRLERLVRKHLTPRQARNLLRLAARRLR